jgi:murein DD-endopeptidase MepM/ murein hydrolase activator NlpD
MWWKRSVGSSVSRRRIIRLSSPRWPLYAAGLALTATLAGGVSAVGAVWRDYVALKRQMAELPALRRQTEEHRQALGRQTEEHRQALGRQTEEHRQALEAARRRIAEVQGEVRAWRDLHAKLWEPFGPMAGASRKGTGTGGGTVSEAPAGADTGLGQELDVLASAVREEGQRLRTYERFISRAGRVLAAIPSRWPLRGTLNSDFGRRSSPWNGKPEVHTGIDLGAATGTPVKAPAPGTVLMAGPKSDYGLAVVLDHGNHIQSLYGHLDQVQVKRGQRVERGQVVALSGNTGRSTGPHLHYEVWVKGEPVNPRGFLRD